MSFVFVWQPVVTLIQILALVSHRLLLIETDVIFIDFVISVTPTTFIVEIKSDSGLHLVRSINNLTICTLNARCIVNKSAIYVDYVNESNADLFAITENWLSANECAVCKELTPSGYKLYHSPRCDRRGGVTPLLFMENITVSKIESASRIFLGLSEYLVTAGSLRFRLVILSIAHRTLLISS